MEEKKLEDILLDAFAKENLLDFLGVADSTLKTFLSSLEKDERFSHLSSINECEAVSIATGKYLASDNPAVVYLQNSGLGKVVHPISSLLVKEVCQIPVLLLIGHRGHVDCSPDEPQHHFMGQITTQLLDVMKIPYEELEGEKQQIEAAVERASAYMKKNRLPYALIVRPGFFPKSKAKGAQNGHSLIRRDVIEKITNILPSESLYVATTGKIARELYFEREKHGGDHSRDLYVVGGMGCASSIGLGVASKLKDRTVCVLDGDGAFLMQMGTVATIGYTNTENLIHIVLDNESYESTGGQRNISPAVQFDQVAFACGYHQAKYIDKLDDLENILTEYQNENGPTLLIVKVSVYSDPKLGRPVQTPKENASSFKNTIISK